MNTPDPCSETTTSLTPHPMSWLEHAPLQASCPPPPVVLSECVTHPHGQGTPQTAGRQRAVKGTSLDLAADPGTQCPPLCSGAESSTP